MKTILKFCNKQGCATMISVDSVYCDKHKTESNTRQKEYDLYRRDGRSTAFYNSSQWLHMQEYIINKYSGIDIYSYYMNNEIVEANTVHHIFEIKECWEKRLSKQNLIPVSGSSHAIIHAKCKKNKATMQQQLFDLLLRYQKDFNIDVDS